MKKIIITLAAALLTISAVAQDYKSLYQKYSDDDRITAVYISPAMFKMIGKVPEVRIEDSDVDFGPMIKSMTGFYLLRFETLMEVKDGGQKVNILSLGNEEFLKSLLLTIFNKDDGETVFIGIDGLMKRSDVEEAVAGASKNLF